MSEKAIERWEQRRVYSILEAAHVLNLSSCDVVPTASRRPNCIDQNWFQAAHPSFVD